MKLGWLIGLGPTVLGCILSSLGMLFMKHSSSTQITLRWLRAAWWLAGFLFLVLLPLPLNMVTFSMTPISVAAPFGGLTILFSLVLARCGVLSVREHISWKQQQAVGLLLLGVVVECVFGPHANKEISLEDVHAVFAHNIPFLVLFVTCMVIIAAHLSSHLLPTHRKPEPASVANVVFLGFTAATCGAFSQLLLKVIAQAVRRQWQGDDQTGEPALYVVIALALTFAPLQLYMLNGALGNTDVVFAVPLYQSLLLTLTMVTGGTFFHEFDELGIATTVGFVCGTFLVVVGLGWLAVATSQQKREVTLLETKRQNSVDRVDTMSLQPTQDNHWTSILD